MKWGPPMHIAVLGTLDTKSDEVDYLRKMIIAEGGAVSVVDTTPATWLTAGPYGSRAELMSRAAEVIRDAVLPRVLAGEFDGVCVIAGATGAALTGLLLSEIPYGVPKILVSPIASSDVRPYIGPSDTVVVPPVADFTGRNAYTDYALARVARLISVMVRSVQEYPNESATHFAASAFGVTSKLIHMLGGALSSGGQRLTVFSANGTGGESFERFVSLGLVSGAFDLTLSELADELCGGVLSAGQARGWAAPRKGIPQVVMPGALDFINYGPLSTVPAERRSRPIVEHTSSVTLVRTSACENFELGRMVAERANSGRETTVVIVPRRGFSLLGAPGGPFSDPEADDAFVQGLALHPEVRVELVDDEFNGGKTLDAVLAASKHWRNQHDNG